MPLIETKGAASAQGFGEFAASSAGAVNYIEDVFSTYLYTGNNSTLSITNGIDVSGKGGLVWIKNRQQAGYYHTLVDTVRGPSKQLYSNTTNAQSTATGLDVTAFTSTGFTLGPDNFCNQNNANNVSWTFRKQPKFFDIVTYTGDGAASRNISHSLGSTPGMVIVKKTSASGDWVVWHRSISSFPKSLLLNTTDSAGAAATYANGYILATSSTTFSVEEGTDTADVNASGATYVAYLFAHDAGGFGLTGTDNVISCGSFTTDGSGYGSVTLGYEPQWILMKDTQSSTIYDNWYVIDNMRGFLANGNANELYANKSDAENANVQRAAPTATGFIPQGLNASKTYIYIAIRRGPMKVPTSGTSVFSPSQWPGSGYPYSTGTQYTGFPVDSLWVNYLSGNSWNTEVYDRLRKASSTNSSVTGGLLSTAATTTESANGSTQAWFNTTFNQSRGSGNIYYAFGRAPSFFDEICYTGTGSFSQTVTHNLGVVPEMAIVKSRNVSDPWRVTISAGGSVYQGYLNSTDTFFTLGSNPSTASYFAAGDLSSSDYGVTYVGYLFASCTGVSKIGKYTGTAALQTINCGFTTGARFVLIRRADSTGDWYVWDSARGITSGNDPYLLLNSTAAETTGTNYVDTDTTGFKVTAAAPAGINASGGTYIFLAIA